MSNNSINIFSAARNYKLNRAKHTIYIITLSYLNRTTKYSAICVYVRCIKYKEILKFLPSL